MKGALHGVRPDCAAAVQGQALARKCSLTTRALAAFRRVAPLPSVCAICGVRQPGFVKPVARVVRRYQQASFVRKRGRGARARADSFIRSSIANALIEDYIEDELYLSVLGITALPCFRRVRIFFEQVPERRSQFATFHRQGE